MKIFFYGFVADAPRHPPIFQKTFAENFRFICSNCSVCITALKFISIQRLGGASISKLLHSTDGSNCSRWLSFEFDVTAFAWFTSSPTSRAQPDKQKKAPLGA